MCVRLQLQVCLQVHISRQQLRDADCRDYMQTLVQEQEAKFSSRHPSGVDQLQRADAAGVRFLKGCEFEAPPLIMRQQDSYDWCQCPQAAVRIIRPGMSASAGSRCHPKGDGALQGTRAAASLPLPAFFCMMAGVSGTGRVSLSAKS